MEARYEPGRLADRVDPRSAALPQLCALRISSPEPGVCAPLKGVAMARISEGHHHLHALRSRSVAEIRHAMLGNDDADVATRRRDGSGQMVDDPGRAAGRHRAERDDRAALL